MTIADIISAIEDFAPLALQQSWDNSGVQIGSTEADVSGVVLALDLTPRVVERAIATGSNLIISHHPLFFEGIKRIEPVGVVGEMIYALIQNNITLYASHTPCDSACGGINDALASLLGLCSVEPLEVSTLDARCGMGRIGYLLEAISAQDFCQLLCDKLSLGALPYSANQKGVIEKVALCGGSGSSMIEQAIAAGADAFVCGDLKYHNFQQVESRISLFDVGHFESEICFLDIISGVLEQKVLKNPKNSHIFALHTVKDNFISHFRS